MRDWLVVLILFAVLTVLTLVTVIYARAAEQEAKEIQKELSELNITAQNRCMVQVVLSYPAPLSQDQFDLVLRDFDSCVVRETGKEAR